MSRTARFGFAALACLAAVSVASSGAQAAVIGGNELLVPPQVTVGQTAISAAIRLTNLNTGAEAALTNTVCNTDVVSSVCFPADGITAIMSCAQPSEETCSGAGEEGVFAVSPTATGAAATACAGMVFDVTAVATTSAQLLFTPQGGASVTLPGTGTTCQINFTFDVLRLPAVDQDPELAGVNTAQVLASTQHAESQFDDAFGVTVMTVDPAPVATSPVVDPAPVATPPPAIGLAPQPATPTISTVASLVGDELTDTATVSGRINPLAGATVRFELYGPDDATCSRTPLLSTNAPLTSAGTATTTPFTPTVPGVYRWRAFYSGDANNFAVSGECNAPGENVTVLERDGRVLGAGFGSRPRVGRTSILTVAAYNASQPISGMSVIFGEPRGRSGLIACQLRSRGGSLKSVPLRMRYTFERPGVHRVRIVLLSGDCTGRLRRTEKTLTVTVAPRRSTSRAALHGGTRAAAFVGSAAKRRARAGCANRFLIPKNVSTSKRVARAVLCLVNAERSKRRLKKLKRSRRLELAALAHNTDMLKRVFFAHEAAGGPTLKTRLRKAGYKGAIAAENIVYGANYTPAAAVRAWMSSPPHRANILHRRLRFAGVSSGAPLPVKPPGKMGSTWTMNFGGSLK